MLDYVKKMFRRKVKHGPLRIEGIADAPLTPEPDDAELAAQALLESLAEMVSKKRQRKKSHERKGKSSLGEATISEVSAEEKGKMSAERESIKDAKYYQDLANRIRQANCASALRATRFVAACEYTLKDKHLPYYGEGSLALLEAELYKRIDVIEREGGELKRRWQNCLAEVTVRLMEAPTDNDNNDNED